MQSFRSPNPLELLNKLPEWKVPKLQNFELAWYRNALSQARIDLEERMAWVHQWDRVLLREEEKRETAAAAIQYRKDRDARHARELEERNARLEMEFNRDTYAE